MDNSDNKNTNNDIVNSVKDKKTNNIAAFLKMLKDPNKPIWVKLFIVAIMIVSIIYVASPIDLVPEMVVGPLGLFDDLAVFAPTLIGILRQISKYKKND